MYDYTKIYAEIKDKLSYKYNPVSDTTAVYIKLIPGVETTEVASVLVVTGRFNDFLELPEPAKNEIYLRYKELVKVYMPDSILAYAKITGPEDTLKFDKKVIDAALGNNSPYLDAYTLPWQGISDTYNSSIAPVDSRETLKNINVENIVLLDYIKELYGEFILNDLSTEEKLTAKQLTIKEWLENDTERNS